MCGGCEHIVWRVQSDYTIFTLLIPQLFCFFYPSTSCGSILLSSLSYSPCANLSKQPQGGGGVIWVFFKRVVCVRVCLWLMPFLLVQLMACCFMLRATGVTQDDLRVCAWDVTSASRWNYHFKVAFWASNAPKGAQQVLVSVNILSKAIDCAGEIFPNQSRKQGKKIFQLISKLYFCHTGMAHPLRMCTFVPQNKYSGADSGLFIFNHSRRMCSFNVHNHCADFKIFLMHTMIQSCMFLNSILDMSGKYGKLFFSFCQHIAIVFSVETNMFSHQVQQQELHSFVSDAFSVSRAPGGAKDRSVWSPVVYWPLHVLIIISLSCSVTVFYSHLTAGGTKCVLCLGSWGFSPFFWTPCPMVHNISPWQLWHT